VTVNQAPNTTTSSDAVVYTRIVDNSMFETAQNSAYASRTLAYRTYTGSYQPLFIYNHVRVQITPSGAV